MHTPTNSLTHAYTCPTLSPKTQKKLLINGAHVNACWQNTITLLSVFLASQSLSLHHTHTPMLTSCLHTRTLTHTCTKLTHLQLTLVCEWGCQCNYLSVCWIWCWSLEPMLVTPEGHESLNLRSPPPAPVPLLFLSLSPFVNQSSDLSWDGLRRGAK